MKIPQQDNTHITRYIRTRRRIRLEDREEMFRDKMRLINMFHKVDENSNILEVGSGTGWFAIYCKMKGISCKGLEISPQLVEYAMEWGREYDIEPDIELANIETTDIGKDVYDAVFANSVFEHVEDWEEGIRRIYEALKPGGVMYFLSTNKFSFTSGEYPTVPLYGWMPNELRYYIRRTFQDHDIMELGIDFHQFTYPGLRRAFKKVGFSQVLDPIQMFDPNNLNNPRAWKKVTLHVLKRVSPFKHIVLTFVPVTTFICVK